MVHHSIFTTVPCAIDCDLVPHCAACYFLKLQSPFLPHGLCTDCSFCLEASSRYSHGLLRPFPTIHISFHPLPPDTVYPHSALFLCQQFTCITKSKFKRFFLFKFKMGHKAAERTHNIENASGPGTAKERTVQWWFKQFCKGDKTLENEALNGQITEADPLTTTQEVTKEINFSHSMVKKLDKWMSHELTENLKKNHCFEVSSSLILHNNESFFNRIMTRNKKWTLYNNWKQLVQWLDQEAAPKHFPKPNLYQEKVLVTVWWSAACLIHYSFLNPNKTIPSEKYAQQINEMHPKLQCLQLVLVNRMGPTLLHDNAQLHIAQPTLQKLNKLVYKVLPHLSYSPVRWPTDYHFFKHLNNFLQEKKPSRPAEGRKCFPRLQKKTNISRWQKCVDCNGSCFD
ncbi:hypothetical protein FD755_002246 [Muntiacus reevesi]|uniref:Mos1 transposase HTH domain-containing protein n=1 Tax=Muntiacus reevesi TaxID=9886 RepID=A0A5J5N9A5_MUNRE|nr:hypothetical protein FD755_002246 [Muntiacus reevesi]